jgi:cell division protein FtsZ
MDSVSSLALIPIGSAAIRAATRARLHEALPLARIFCVDTDLRGVPRPLRAEAVPLHLQVRGLYDGGDPQCNAQAAEASLPVLRTRLQGVTKSVLVAALGGGTGGGATPVIARALQEWGLTVIAVATTPFPFEGKRRQRAALSALEAISREVDELVLHRNIITDEMRKGNLRWLDIWATANAHISGMIERVLTPAAHRIPFNHPPSG